MRRIEPAFPDLLPVTHTVRPGYMPGSDVVLDPIRMKVVWQDAPKRTLPNKSVVARQPVNTLAFATVLARRQDLAEPLLERGSSLLVVLDDPSASPEDLGLGDSDPDRASGLLPVLPPPLGELEAPEAPAGWNGHGWGAVVGLFPLPGVHEALAVGIRRLADAGASFVLAAPLLLTRRDRRRIVDLSDRGDGDQAVQDSLFHTDVASRMLQLECEAGSHVVDNELSPVVTSLVPDGTESRAVHTARLLRLWARRLDQSDAEGSAGWRLRRAAAALEASNRDPRELAAEDNLRVVPGFDPWVESFTRSLWEGGEPLDDVRQRWRQGACG